MKNSKQNPVHMIPYVVFAKTSEIAYCLNDDFKKAGIGVEVEEAGENLFCQVPQENAQKFISLATARGADLELEYKPAD